jgi:hypothetical protein
MIRVERTEGDEKMITFPGVAHHLWLWSGLSNVSGLDCTATWGSGSAVRSKEASSGRLGILGVSVLVLVLVRVLASWLLGFFASLASLAFWHSCVWWSHVSPGGYK